VAILFAAGCGSPAAVAPTPDASDATVVEGSSGASESGISVGDSTMSGSDDSMPSADDSSTSFDGGTAVEASDAPYDGPITGSITHPCSLPGSIVRTMSGQTIVPGGKTATGGALPDVSFIDVPVGFCVHYFGNVGNARQIRFAPGGEAFVASPTGPTTSGGPNGLSAIVVLPDDDNDGVADKTITFLNKSVAKPGMALAYTQGMLFNGGYFYYQDSWGLDGTATIRRLPYAAGQRAPSGPSELVADIGANHHQDSLHWVKSLDVADDGTIYVGNGGSQGDSCVQPPWPFLGGILKLDGTPGGSIVARGLRNPNAIRCSRGHNLCFALELAKDYSASEAGREKLFPIHQGDDWGFPCCATQGVPYADAPYISDAGKSMLADCSGIAPVNDSFLIGDTPFGLDFESGVWPGMWAGRVFIANHGAAGTWVGARLVAIAMDPTTGLPAPGTNYMGGADVGSLVDFATGWDNGINSHGRPTAVSFSPDGRLFLTNDTTGDIVWIAPSSL
jgi:glucose/arabinose dehydrogenase